MGLSFFRTVASHTQSATASRSVSAGSRSTLVPTRMIGLAPTRSRTLDKKLPLKSAMSTCSKDEDTLNVKMLLFAFKIKQR